MGNSSSSQPQQSQQQQQQQQGRYGYPGSQGSIASPPAGAGSSSTTTVVSRPASASPYPAQARQPGQAQDPSTGGYYPTTVPPPPPANYPSTPSRASVPPAGSQPPPVAPQPPGYYYTPQVNLWGRTGAYSTPYTYHSYYYDPAYRQLGYQQGVSYYGGGRGQPHNVQYGYGAYVAGSAYPTNGPYFFVPQQTAAQPMPPLPIQVQHTKTIKNSVNLKKSSLRLVPDKKDPGWLNVAFEFDAVQPCSVSVLFVAEEDGATALKLRKGRLIGDRKLAAPRVHFPAGSGQHFAQVEGAKLGLRPEDFTAVELSQDGTVTTIYSLIIRLECVPPDEGDEAVPADESRHRIEALGDVGCELPESIHAQTTYATLIAVPDSFTVKVLKQKLWVEGRNYELHEVFGLDSAPSTSTAGATSNTDAPVDGVPIDDSGCGGECVICLTERKDTMALPCGHMCMCYECADVLRVQSRTCPICRRNIESLFRIMQEPGDDKEKASEKEGGQDKDHRKVGASSSAT